MIQGVLDLGARPPSHSSGIKHENFRRQGMGNAGAKRERVKDENDSSDDLYTVPRKRLRQGDSINLTEES